MGHKAAAQDVFDYTVRRWSIKPRWACPAAQTRLLLPVRLCAFVEEPVRHVCIVCILSPACRSIELLTVATRRVVLAPKNILFLIPLLRSGEKTERKSKHEHAGLK